ncbi:MAG: IS1634 family transposase, partial [Leptospirillum sp.]
DREGARANRESIVAPSVPSDKTRKKAETHRTEDGFPVQSFRSMLRNLGTLARNRVRAGEDREAPEFSLLTQATPLQKKAFDLLALTPTL